MFSDGIYPTKITKSNLPNWYIYGRYYKCFGYLSAKSVKDVVYIPNTTFNHMFKYDNLLISYDKKIIKNQNNNFAINSYTNYDEVVSGSIIIELLNSIKKYSNYDISKIVSQIKTKRLWFKKAFTNDYVLQVGEKTEKDWFK